MLVKGAVVDRIATGTLADFGRDSIVADRGRTCLSGVGGFRTCAGSEVKVDRLGLLGSGISMPDGRRSSRDSFGLLSSRLLRDRAAERRGVSTTSSLNRWLGAGGGGGGGGGTRSFLDDTYL